MAELNYKDQKLGYQPFHDVIAKFDTVCRSKNIGNPFTEKGFESVLQYTGLVDTLVDGMAAQFKGAESLQTAYKSCVKHAFQEHNNSFSQVRDINDYEMGIEGYGATAITGNYNAYTRLAPVLTAGYLARARSLEMFQIINEDKPTFWREYTVNYIQKGLGGERLILPKAIRAGKVSGILDLPQCEPVDVTKNPDNTNITRVDVGGGKFVNMVAAGTSGNLMDQSAFDDGRPVDKFKHALERVCSIDYVQVEFPKGGTGPTAADLVTKAVRVRIERDIKTNKTSERFFNDVVVVDYKDSDDLDQRRVIRVVALIDLDTGNYQVMTDGTTELKGVHFKIRITNVANEMETYMNGTDKYILSFDIENKIYGSIPIIPEMMADYNAGGEGVSWLAYMTDQMTESYAGIRDNDLEAFVDENFGYATKDFELAFKLGGYKFNGTYPLIPRHPGGTDDILAPQRMAFKQYLTRVFTRSEKFTNFDKNIERQWIIMANDEDVDILPDVSWQSSTSEMTGEGATNFRFGFSLDDAYGWMDNFGRKVRVIGSKDERWLGRPIWAVQKSLSIAAPTLIYMPYMFRAFSSISPDMRNRPAMLFASRDAKRCSTMSQVRITLEGNDLSLYANSAAFAAGQTSAYTPVYTENGTADTGFKGVNPKNTLPNYIPGGSNGPYAENGIDGQV